MRTLILNSDWTVDEVVSWRRAILMVLADKVISLEAYPGRKVRSPSIELPLPAVLVRKRFVRRRRVRLSRRNILARDAYTCQYCGAKPRRRSGLPRFEDLTIDHVVPRAQSTEGRVLLPWSGERAPVTCWRNVLTACRSCNCRKGGRTPDQAGLVMRRIPSPPNPNERAWMQLNTQPIPVEWKDYLPAGSPWRDYWEVDLRERTGCVSQDGISTHHVRAV